jgi:methylamine methyltransferase corrinoid protein reductive activase
MEEADIDIRDLNSVYMAGALGTYVDPLKAQKVGLIPPKLDKVVQIGNTSLAMAVDLVRDREVLDEMQEFANSLRSKHIMFANSETFKNTFINELGLRVEGMPFELYNKTLQRFGLQQVPLIKKPRKIIRAVKRDIPVLGKKGLKIVDHIGLKLVGIFKDCTACGACAKECPEGALTVKKGSPNTVVILSELCNGTACKRCEWICSEKTFRFEDLIMKELS